MGQVKEARAMRLNISEGERLSHGLIAPEQTTLLKGGYDYFNERNEYGRTACSTIPREHGKKNLGNNERKQRVGRSQEKSKRPVK